MDKLSRYVLRYTFDTDSLLYNSINGDIAIIPSVMLDGLCTRPQSYSQIVKTLHKKGFFSSDFNRSKLVEKYNSEDVLLISLELFLGCNLSCPYCYQINNSHYKGVISDNNICLLLLYIEKVYNKTHFRFLVFKILGGEPTVNWEPASKVISKVYDFCQRHSIHLNLRIDTNGTSIQNLLSLNYYDSILFTIPLCEKSVHDRYRHFSNGEGTYDTILRNIQELSLLPNSTIIIRHNTDLENINLFEAFISDLDDKIEERRNVIQIIPYYTVNPSLGKYNNTLSHPDFIKWKSSQCVDILVKYGFPVYFGPKKLLSGKCQCLSQYSIKVFSDGKVGACAVYFFDKNNPTLKDILEIPDSNFEKYWGGIKGKSILSNKKCLDCPSIFVCAGDYHLPCMKELGYTHCDKSINLSIDLSNYFSKVYLYNSLGKSQLFKNNNIINLG